MIYVILINIYYIMLFFIVYIGLCIIYCILYFYFFCISYYIHDSLHDIEYIHIYIFNLVYMCGRKTCEKGSGMKRSEKALNHCKMQVI